jgi:hypothetical protein
VYLSVKPYGVKEPTKIRMLYEEDFQQILKEFPFLESSFIRYRDLNDIVKDMAYQLSSHNIDAWVSFD